MNHIACLLPGRSTASCMRHDNADLRVTGMDHNHGLITEERYRRVTEKKHLLKKKSGA